MNRVKKAARAYHYRKLYGKDAAEMLRDNRKFRNRGRPVNEGLARRDGLLNVLEYMAALRTSKQLDYLRIFCDAPRDKETIGLTAFAAGKCSVNELNRGQINELAVRLGWQE